ncbi:hypothetical protein [Streptomyces sp. NPDC002853]
MAHPVMFEDDDPYLVRLRRVALAFPDAEEQIAHGRPGFRAGKYFAWYGGSTKGSADDRIRYDRALIVLPDDADRAALAEDKRFFEPAYLAPSGWIGIDLAAGGTTAPRTWTGRRWLNSSTRPTARSPASGGWRA